MSALGTGAFWIQRYFLKFYSSFREILERFVFKVGMFIQNSFLFKIELHVELFLLCLYHCISFQESWSSMMILYLDPDPTGQSITGIGTDPDPTG